MTTKTKMSVKQRLYHLSMAKDLLEENSTQFAPIIELALKLPPQKREIYFLKYHLFLEQIGRASCRERV